MKLFGHKTREPRRRANSPAWISYDGGFGVQPCTVLNVSRGGAWLRVDGAGRLPKTFSIMFERGSRVGKKCQIVWRVANDIGVKFTV
jgi:hypothetical protein